MFVVISGNLPSACLIAMKNPWKLFRSVLNSLKSRGKLENKKGAEGMKMMKCNFRSRESKLIFRFRG